MERTKVTLDTFQKHKYFGTIPKMSRLDEVKMLIASRYYDELRKAKTNKYSNALPWVDFASLSKQKNYNHFALLIVFLKTYRIEYKLYIESCFSAGSPYPSQLCSLTYMKNYIKYRIQKKAEDNLIGKLKAERKFNDRTYIREEIQCELNKLASFIKRRDKKGIGSTLSKAEFILDNIEVLSPFYLATFSNLVKLLDEDKVCEYPWYTRLKFVTKDKKILAIAIEETLELEKEMMVPHGLDI